MRNTVERYNISMSKGVTITNHIILFLPDREYDIIYLGYRQDILLATFWIELHKT